MAVSEARGGKRRGWIIAGGAAAVAAGWIFLHRLAGQMLLRSMDRAETLYESMQLRGFAGEFPLPGRRISAGRTAAFLVIACASLLILRFTPLLSVIGGIFV